MTNFFEFRDAVVMTLCSLIFTLPISLVFFEQLSIISPVANVLAAAAIPPAMLFGFLSIIIFPLHEGIATGI